MAIFGCRCSRAPGEQPPELVYADANRLFEHGDLTEAQAKTSEGRRRFSRKDPNWDWKFRFLEAKVRTQQGRSRDVMALMKDELPPQVANPDFAIERYVRRATALAGLGELTQAEAEARAALELSTRTHSPLQSDAFGSAGFVALASEHLDDATSMFRAGLKAARAKRDTYLETKMLINLGVIALREEHYDEELDLLGNAAELARKIGAKILLQNCLGDIGFAYHELGDHERALDNFQEASRQAEHLGAGDEAGWLNNAGLEMYMLGDQKGAEASYRKALALAEGLHNARETVNVLMDLAYLLFEQGRYGEASEYSNRALKSARAFEVASAEIDLTFLNGRLAAQKGDRKEAEREFQEVDANKGAWPFQHVEAEDALAALFDTAKQPEVAERWYRKALATFEKQRDSIGGEESRLPFSTNADQVYSDYASFLIHHHREEEALQLLDLGRARTLEEGLGLDAGSRGTPTSENVDPRALARKLDATILVYSLGPQESYLWCVTQKGMRFFTLPKEDEIASRVNRYQKAILESTDVLSTDNPAGHALYDALIAPAQPMIPSHSRVFVVADSVLNGLNFETLLVSQPAPHYWIDDVAVTNANSLRMIQSFARHEPRRGAGSLLLMGDAAPAGIYQALPQATEEVTAVTNHFASGKRLVLTGDRAYPSAYTRSHPELYSYIHFVAHGTANHLTPLESAVVLSRTPGEPEAFKLYARDVIRAPLHAELVTISACYGSGSRAYSGEGLLGLSWAFLRAGAHHVVGALWQVSDSATPQIMDRLYTELNHGLAPDAALRAAKLALVHSPRTYRKPLYWAGFQLYAGS